MTLFAPLLGLVLALASAAPLQSDDPLAPALEGMVQCVGFNPAHRTCMGISRYDFDGGRIRIRTELLIAASPEIVMIVTGPVTMRGAEVCETIPDYGDSTLTVDGQPASDDIRQAVISQMNAATGAYRGQQACSTNVPDGDAWRAEASINGRRRPELDQPFIWVSPSDGYRLGL